MNITVTIEEPNGEFQSKLLTLLAEHAADVEIDTAWTVERAARYYNALPPRAQRIVRYAAAGDGYVSADDLREDGNGSLRGHSAALKRLLERGAGKGWWPQSIQAPIVPQGPGFGKVVGYRMPSDLVQTFYTAIAESKRGERP